MPKVVKNIIISILVFVVALFAAVYLATPALVRHYAAEPLSAYGLQIGEGSAVTYNLLTSRVSIDDLTLLDAEQATVASIQSLHVDLQLYQLLFKRIKISEVRLSGGHLAVEKNADNIIVAGVNLSQLPSEQDTAEQPTTEQSQYQLVLDDLHVADFKLQALIDTTEHSFVIDDLSVRDALFDAHRQELAVMLNSRLNDAPVKLTSNIALDNAEGNGDMTFSIEELALASFSQFMPDPNMQLAGSLSLNLAPQIQFSQNNIQAEFSDLALLLTDAKVSAQPWLYAGEKHEFKSQDLNLSFDLSSNQLDLTGVIDSELSAGNVFIEDENNLLAAWQRIHFSPQIQLLADSQQVDVAKLEIEDIKLSEVLQTDRSRPVANIGSFSLQQISYKDNYLSIENALLADVSSVIAVQADGSVTGLVDVSALSEQTEAKESAEQVVDEASAQTADAFNISLGQFRLQPPFEISIQDQSVEPAYTQVLELQELTFGPLDSQSPQRATPFNFALKDNEHLAMAFTGETTVFTELVSASLQGKLMEMNLTKISPYIKDGLGFEMKSGQLDVDVDLQVKQNQLEGDTRLVMRGLEMTKADEYEQGTIKEGQAMPLNVALNLLKDGQGNLDLNVPVSGDISDPSFGISSFIMLIVKKAAMRQTKSYLINTFIPYANVVTVVLTGADYLLQLRLEPLVYQPKQLAKNEEQKTYMQQLANLMAEKSELSIKTCSVSTPSDLDLPYNVELTKAQTQELVALGNQRQELMKKYLMAAEIDSSRILSCTPEIDNGEDAKPRIELNAN